MKNLFLLFTLFFTHSFLLLAQTDPCVRTSEGREFWVGFMHNDPAPDPNIRLYVTSRFATTGTVFADGGATNVQTINVAANASQLTELTPINTYSVFNTQTIQNKGVFVSKVFQGEGFDVLFSDLKLHFNKVVTRKPDASRARSREIYVVATGFKGS